ncbi:MAG: helix-turn-helix transcriptional regulator [Bacteroidetes bacterium]|nr:helix-turn-helix transcriptional regulator [Bacteroidota bacterium]
MLQYNLTKIFQSRGIEKPYAFLKKQGFSHNLAHRIAQNKIDMLSLEHLEKLCTLLSCTPNDLLDWFPKKEDETAARHPLNALRRAITTVDLPAFLRETPLHKLQELQTMLDQLRKDK